MRHGHAARIGPSKLLHVSSLLLLSCGLTACDPPWSASTDTQALSVTSAGTDAGSRVASAPPAAAAALAPKAVKGEAQVAEPTPIPVEVELTPMEQAGDPEGNARLAVRYRNAEELGDVVYFAVDEKREYALKRDQKEPDKYVAMIDFDFDLFAKEQEQRRAAIYEAKLDAFDAFDGRTWTGEEKFAFLDPAEVSVARLKSLPLRIRPGVIMPPVMPSFDPGKTLMITDLSVVRDPTRTFDICGNYGNPNGAWTFKTLMTNMANQSATGVDPAVFVENWLQTWNTNATINTYAVPARTKISTKVLDAWPRIGGKLDLNRSPMRLLAIVNRLDLRNGATRSSPYGVGGRTLDAGEGRFVFGVVDRNASGGCSKMDFTVILEYRVPIQQCAAVRSYAQQWGALTGLALGSPVYNNALEAITNQFTGAGVAPGKPNGSAISQIRTNEIALANTGYGGLLGAARTASLSGDSAEAIAMRPPGGGSSDPWELREFNLDADHQLHLVTTKGTPHHSFNQTSTLADIINGTYTGTSWVTGSTLNFAVTDAAVWDDGLYAADPEKRRKFSLGTCDACHGGETRYNENPLVAFPSGSTPETSFVHVTPRLPNVASDLSKFLTGTGTLSSPSTFPKDDPIQPWAVSTSHFGDLLRRKTDMASLTVARCEATAVLQEVMFRPVLEAH